MVQKYLDFQFKMIPLRGKIPIDKDWPSKGSRDIQKITGWIEKGYNIGILTGLPSGVIVLDVDGEEGETSLLSLGQVIDTFTVETGNGVHYYFQTNKTHKNRVRVLPGLDIRADGGQVVAPPSIHPKTGNLYQIINDREPAEIPEWLEILLAQETGDKSGMSGKGTYLTAGKLPVKPVEGEPIPEGQRNNTLFLIGCSMRGSGAGYTDILSRLSDVNNSLCSPSLDDREIRTIANQASNYREGEKPGDYTSIFCGADEVDITIPGRIYEYLRKKPGNDFSRMLVVYTAIRQITLLNNQEPIYNYTGYIAENYGVKDRYIPGIIREFGELGILTLKEKNREGSRFVQREIEFHPSRFNGESHE